jgi:hypothetical protein
MNAVPIHAAGRDSPAGARGGRGAGCREGGGRRAVGPAGPRLVNVAFRVPPEQPEGKAA